MSGEKRIGREVSRGLIALKFGIPLSEVEERPIKEYRLMLFTAINTAALESGLGGFQYQTPEEEDDELSELVDFFKDRGVFN